MYFIIENPATVFADKRVTAISGEPPNAPLLFTPSIFTEPAVGSAPAALLLSVVGAPPAFQLQNTLSSPFVFCPKLSVF